MNTPTPFIRHALAVCALTAATHATAGTATTAQQYGSYVILGQDGKGNNIALARTIIDANLGCPTVTSASGSNTISMTTRDNPYHFPVMVCEALVNFDLNYQLNFADGKIALPIAKSAISTVQVFGDTGCKSSDCAPGAAAEPFKTLADSAVVDKPDVIVHMGDFNYRGTGGQVEFTMKDGSGKLTQVPQWTYDAGDDLTEAEHCGQKPGSPFYSQSATNANRPDSWQYWQEDLFMPAQKLLLSAPWIVARGNHELCSRAGPGYFYFLDPHSNLADGQRQIGCPAPNVNKGAMANAVQVPNYTVGFATFDIAVVDSANACDSFTDSPFTKRYKKVFKNLNKTVKKAAKETWIVTHRPIWGVQYYDDGKAAGCTSANQYGCINQMMQTAIESLPQKALDKHVALVLSGHMHKFESVAFDKAGHPPNLIVGSSGVALAGADPQGSGTTSVNGLAVKVLTTNTQVQYNNQSYDAFSYLNIKRQGSNWQGQLVNPSQNLLIAECTSKQNYAQGVCQLASGISVVNQ